MMRNSFLITVFAGLSLSLTASAQNRKPGLWEVTTTQTWQKSPLPPGVVPPNIKPGATMPFSTSTHTSQVCVTQEQIDKYGAILPPQTRGGCQVSNIVKKEKGMTADLICTGSMTGKATIEGSSTDDTHATSKVHFTGTLQMGPNTLPIEWTNAATSVFKNSDCGEIKPMSAPEK